MRRLTPSPAMVVSLIALFVALASEIEITKDGAVSVFFVDKSYVGLSNISFRAGL